MKFVGRGHLYRLVFGGHASFEKSSGSGGLFSCPCGQEAKYATKIWLRAFPALRCRIIT